MARTSRGPGISPGSNGAAQESPRRQAKAQRHTSGSNAPGMPTTSNPLACPSCQGGSWCSGRQVANSCGTRMIPPPARARRSQKSHMTSCMPGRRPPRVSQVFLRNSTAGPTGLKRTNWSDRNGRMRSKGVRPGLPAVWSGYAAWLCFGWSASRHLATNCGLKRLPSGARRRCSSLPAWAARFKAWAGWSCEASSTVRLLKFSALCSSLASWEKCSSGKVLARTMLRRCGPTVWQESETNVLKMSAPAPRQCMSTLMRVVVFMWFPFPGMFLLDSTIRVLKKALSIIFSAQPGKNFRPGFETLLTEGVALPVMILA